jgi:hypothetical protein
MDLGFEKVHLGLQFQMLTFVVSKQGCAKDFSLIYGPI